jgi:hypothetical protein
MDGSVVTPKILKVTSQVASSKNECSPLSASADNPDCTRDNETSARQYHVLFLGVFKNAVTASLSRSSVFGSQAVTWRVAKLHRNTESVMTLFSVLDVHTSISTISSFLLTDRMIHDQMLVNGIMVLLDSLDSRADGRQIVEPVRREGSCATEMLRTAISARARV